MRLLHASNLVFKEFVGSNIPKYIIISHRWSDEEVSHQDFLDGRRDFLYGRCSGYGWVKIAKACQLAKKADIEWVWIDTCCIDKKSSAELTEAINSMFNWYQRSTECLVFLPDVEPIEGRAGLPPSADGESKWELPVGFLPEALRASVWFTRAWTLQELLAPEQCAFFNSKFEFIGTKRLLATLISERTKIPELVLSNAHSRWGHQIRSEPVAVRMHWASSREATRVEDLAYSLLGLFGVSMPLLYGEGDRAFLRLQKELIGISDDETIFLSIDTTIPHHNPRSAIAANPLHFMNVPHYMNVPVLYRDLYVNAIPRLHYEVTNKGIRFEVQISRKKLSALVEREPPRIRHLPQHFEIIMPLNCYMYNIREMSDSPIAIKLRVASQSTASITDHQSLSVLRGTTHNDFFYGSLLDKEARRTPDDNLSSYSTWVSWTTGEKADADIVVGEFDGSEVACQVYVEFMPEGFRQRGRLLEMLLNNPVKAA
ncbi:hypothetical protein LTR37_019927 [Vermiconidia calcicola]|uniref:Uncharacterized protein n=1 Tax=Vermiconidia calcicola TaxID=1690605 RepID=A0ACC3MEM6_9PEZI|nr:hypothetical protein LTR37_019927 [Vermiconidia calcicola]